ncbi:hypothetical protein NVP2096O_05 [Vibrio phage 2.096.O._10N.286.48.B5]|nr:hypothetical protein NVP2096O_05 [Vibrio phage 2.096.O._10N.286.48.B5]
MMKHVDYDELKALAESVGYSVIDKIEYNCLYVGSFESGNRVVWKTFNSFTMVTQWQTADLINGHYTNHLLFNNLTDALQRDL